MAAFGQSPVVLQDCLRWLALRGLTTPRLFAAPLRSEDRKLLALRHLYDTGRRPLRSKSCRDKDPHLIAGLLLAWLRALPEPLFPAALVPELVQSQQSDYYEERVTAVRALLKRADPFVVEALFPLFELLHHYWINQADRDSCLQELGRLLAPAVFGTPRQHGLPQEDGGLLTDTVEMLVSEYRPLFTQPFNLRRYDADVARQAAAAQQAEAARLEAQRHSGSVAQAAADASEAQASAAGVAMSSPLLTPIRCERLSVMAPEGASPFSDCCGTPLPASAISFFLDGSPAGASPPFSPMAQSPRQRPAVRHGGFGAFQQVPVLALPPCAIDEEYSQLDNHLEEAFSSLLESTVSGMLFDLPMSLPGACNGAGAGAPGCMDLEVAAEAPGSPVAVLMSAHDAGDITDGSDCDAPMACSQQTATWPRPAAVRSIASC